MIIPTDKPLRERSASEFYPTPYELCVAALNTLPDWFTPRRVCDPGAGTGVWCDAARAKWPNAYIIGVEVRPDAPKPASVDEWITMSFIDWKPDGWIDLCCGNPPYGDPEEQEYAAKKRAAKKQFDAERRTAPPAPIGKVPKFEYPKLVRQTTYADAEAFVRHSLTLTRHGGFDLFLLRLAFLESGKRGRGLYKEFKPTAVDTCMDRPSFITEGDKAGNTDATAYGVFTFRKDYYPDRYSGGFLDWKPKRVVTKSKVTQLELVTA